MKKYVSKVYCDKKTFNPDTNYFDIKRVSIEYEWSEEEIKYKRRADGYFTAGIISLITGLVFILIIGLAIFGTINLMLPSIIFVSLGFMLILVGFTVLLRKNEKYQSLYWELSEELRESRSEELLAGIKAYNAEQQKIADAWRVAHPLEEKIRACLKDNMSSVAIAELARYYAEVYIKDNKN